MVGGKYDMSPAMKLRSDRSLMNMIKNDPSLADWEDIGKANSLLFDKIQSRLKSLGYSGK
jgi:hypothetical protein